MVKTYNVKANRKKSKARAVIRSGSGKIRINKKPAEQFTSRYLAEIINEPRNLAPEVFKKYDFSVNVYGGGVASQVQAVRNALAKGMLEASGNKKTLKNRILDYDRSLITDDVRNKEPKKQLGRGARKKKQQSKR